MTAGASVITSKAPPLLAATWSPPTCSPAFVEALRDRLAVAELGATMLTGLVGDVSIPKRTGRRPPTGSVLITLMP